MNTRTFASVGGLVLAGQCIAGPIDRAWVEPDAHWVAHVDIERAMQSQFVRDMVLEHAAEDLRFDFSDFVEEMLGEDVDVKAQNPVFDLTRDLKGITIFGRDDTEEPELLVVQTSGAVVEFMRALKEYPQFEVIEHGGYAISQWKEGDETIAAIVQPTGEEDTYNVVASDSPDRLIQALGAAELRRGAGGGLIDDEPGPNSVVYVRVNSPRDVIRDHDLPPFFQHMDRFVMNIGAVGDAWTAEMSVTTPDEQAAQDLQQMAGGLVAAARLMGGQEPELRPALDMLSKLRMSSEQNSFRVSITVDSETIRQMMESIEECEQPQQDNDAEIDQEDAGHAGADVRREVRIVAGESD